MMKSKDMELNNIMKRYGIIGKNPKLLMALSKAIQVAPTDLTILITGESGVGKDVFSKVIHDNSERRHQKNGLIAVNCGAIPEGTIESELFGHIKGSFTGADKDRKGYFEEANGGTIFLDEVGELPLATQVKLLRVLENGEILPVGSSMPRKVDVRVVTATNVDLLQAVKAGKFREDLYYRINQITIAIPALRERREDIPLLFRKFSSDVAEKYKMQPIFLTEDAQELLMKYPWYGNVRELKNITEQISVVETERTITRDILQNYLTSVPDEKMPVLVSPNVMGTAEISDRELLLKALSMGQMINEMRGELNNLRQAVAHLASSIPGGQVPVQAEPMEHYQTITQPAHPIEETEEFAEAEEYNENEFTPTEVVEDDLPGTSTRHERTVIEKALAHNLGNRRLTAKELHISERTLYRKLKEYGLG